MENEQLKKFRIWFDNYVVGFYGDDEFVNANLELKQKHSHRVCEEMLYLTEKLSLTGNQSRIADATALLHDIGRFRQFVEHRTYNDARSVNHCLLALEVFGQTNVLDDVELGERQLIEKAIEYHGCKELPKNLDGQCLLFSKLIRDADKLDIFYVVTTYYKQYIDDPVRFMLELEFPDEPGYSSEIVEDILCGRKVDYRKLQTLNDMKLLQLGWVYDVNSTATLERIKQRKFLEMLIDFLPKTEDIDRVREKVFAFVDFRIERDK